MLVRLIVGLGVVALTACGDGGGSSPSPDGGPDGDAGDGGITDPGDRNVVAFENPALGLIHGESAVLEISYRRPDGRPITNAAITLGLIGEAHDSSLSATCVGDGGGDIPCLTPRTDGEGTVRATLVAGAIPAVFRISARAADGASASLDVGVSNGGVGVLAVRVPYEGTRDVVARRIRLYSEARCGERPWELLPQAPERTDLVTGSASEVSFTGLPAGRTYTLLAVGTGPSGGSGTDGPTVALGCRDDVLVTEGETSRMTVPVADLPAVVDGTYELTIRIEGDAHPARVGERVRDAADEAIELAGGEATLFLDALETVLGANGSDESLDAVALARDEGADAVLSKRLLASGTGIATAAAWLATDLEGRLAEIEIEGEGNVDLRRDPTMTATVSAITAGAGTLALSLDVPAVDVAPVITWWLFDEGGAFEPLLIQLPLGQLSVALLSALLDDAGAPSTAALLANRFGCSPLAAWIEGQPEVAAGCDLACVQAACETAFAAGTLGLEARLRTFDDRRRTVVLFGDLTLDVAVGGGVSALAGPFLDGDWSPSSEEAGDAVAGRLVGVRTGPLPL